MKSPILVFLFIIASFCLNGQVINGYAKVSAITGSTLTLTNFNQTGQFFAVGNWVIIMQMQDNNIGANTTEAATFGNLSAIANTGRYEVRQVLSINGTSTVGFTSATPTTVVVSTLGSTYNINANSSVQLITFRRMAATNYTTIANTTALPWDGNVGGVIAMEIPGIFTLNHNITADGVGFRGGAISNNYSGGFCFTNPYRANDANAAYKGEGIYKNTLNTYFNGRAKILSGGGGGVSENGGGGGGGNFTTGGNGGGGYDGSGGGCTGNAGYGFGGIALSGSIGANRIFMGGAGGGGQQNNTASTAGGNGGGIIFIKAGTLRTTGTCTQRVISVNGQSSANSGNDGAGGAGAAGTIVFHVGTWSVLAACDLVIAANGGNGGSVNSVTHGGGGAGAQGVVQFNGPQPTTNISTTTLNGSAGCNNNTTPCTNFAGSASGTNNTGIFNGQNTPLPIELVFFELNLKDDNSVKLFWQTSNEINNEFFTIDRSKNGLDWTELKTMAGSINSNDILDYSFVDSRPFSGQSYYRLKQTDLDGNEKHLGIRSLFLENEEIRVFPNPAQKNISFQGPIGSFDDFEILDIMGKNMYSSIEIQENSNVQLVLSIEKLSEGIYYLRTADTVIRFVKN